MAHRNHDNAMVKLSSVTNEKLSDSGCATEKWIESDDVIIHPNAAMRERACEDRERGTILLT